MSYNKLTLRRVCLRLAAMGKGLWGNSRGPLFGRTMNVEDLIKELSQLPPNTPMALIDPDTSWFMEIRGVSNLHGYGVIRGKGYGNIIKDEDGESLSSGEWF